MSDGFGKLLCTRLMANAIRLMANAIRLMANSIRVCGVLYRAFALIPESF